MHFISLYSLASERFRTWRPGHALRRGRYARGHFAGQHGYGYRSIEEFVAAAEEVNGGAATAEDVSAGFVRTSNNLERVVYEKRRRVRTAARWRSAP